MPGKIHFELAEKKAKELAEKLDADKNITLVGYYLMDLKLGEAMKQEQLREHVKMSVEAAKPFLGKFGLDEETKKKIINCIQAHHGDVPFICKESEICANADCYRFIHPKGFFTLLINIGKDLGFEKTLGLAEQKLDEKYKILSINICKEELEDYYHQFKELIKKAKGI
jgi:hypothetical protein